MQITNSWKRRLIGLWLAHITFLNLTSQLPLNEKSTTLKEYLFSRRYNGKTEISNILNLVFFFASLRVRDETVPYSGERGGARLIGIATEIDRFKKYLLEDVITLEILNILNFVVFTRRYVSEMKHHSGERGGAGPIGIGGMRLMLRMQV